MPGAGGGFTVAEAGKLLGSAPCVTLSLSPGVPTNSKLPPTQQWLAVAPDALAAAQLHAGQRMLVGIVDIATTALPPGIASPSSRASQLTMPSTPTSTFAPQQLPDLSSEGTRLTNLWESTRSMCGIRAPHITPSAAGTGSFGKATVEGHVHSKTTSDLFGGGQRGDEGSMGTSGEGKGDASSCLTPTQRRGRDHRGRGTSMHAQDLLLSQQQQKHEGQQEQEGELGQYLLVVRVWPCARLPRGCAALSTTAAEACGRPKPGASAVALFRMPHALQLIPACRTLVLQVCFDAHRCKPATLAGPSVKLGPTGSMQAQVSGGSGTSTPTPSTRKLPGTPSSASNNPPNVTHAATPAPATSAPDILQPPAALGDWVLDLLTPPPAAGSSSTGSSLTEAQRSMLGHAVARHLCGRALLRGNPVLVPLLGHTLLCSVAAALEGARAEGDQGSKTAAAEATAGGASGAAGAEATLCEAGMAAWQVVAGVTEVVLLLEGEDLPEDVAAQLAPLSNMQSRDKGSCKSLQGHAALPAWAFGRSMGQLVSQVREAAEAEVKGSSAEAAAIAAERALRSGLAAHSASGFQALGGVAPFAASLRELVALPLRAPHLFAGLRVRPPRGVLLHGPPGGGKTVLARAAAADAGAALLIVNGPDVVSEFFGESEAGLRGVFAAAKCLAPSVVFIDEVDALAPARGGGEGGGGMAGALSGSTGGAGDSAARLVTVLLTLMDGAGGAGPGDGVVVIAATNRPGALDSALRRPGRFERELEVGVPGPQARADVLRARLQLVPRHSLEDADIEALANAAHGYVGADLAALVNEAALVALRRVVAMRQQQQQRGAGQLGFDSAGVIQVKRRRGETGSHSAGGDSAPSEQDVNPCPERAASEDGPPSGQDLPISEGAHSAVCEPAELCVTKADFATAEARVRPSALRELAVEVPCVGWADVGGLDDVKQRLREAVEWPFRVPGALARVGAQAPRGVLLYGPPGCSKTLLARAVACEAKLNFLAIKGGELYSKYTGKSCGHGHIVSKYEGPVTS
ncbi:P-loop containing nucleoside triphosphate hydrolase protein [Dunaliella salina]|uniref:P-loop containing nucleoside triphosphate hydrolase protein n=1 Tax=Dunaliella salina TaxID=3046 RepID=A0ABQ7H987_DUNSA|nr:P-loop containing nucleoside triphosphate hydrolase protein [Dunaliella salina]|eukprot:KAF5843411.1 P-loop containing nucleoside triphosphate hydrolase protein [Dunaliella salina]